MRSSLLSPRALWCDILFVVAEPDIVARLGEGVPGDMEPGGAGEELVCEVVIAEEFDKTLELLRIFGADISGLTDEVLRVLYAADPKIDGLVTEA